MWVVVGENAVSGVDDKVVPWVKCPLICEA